MGTTIEKLNYLNETKGLFKDRLNSLGGNVTENTKFRDYLTWVDNFYNEVDDHTLLNNKGLEGETEQAAITYDAGKEVENTSIEINDLDNDRENYITLKGNTYQENTTGKNLFGTTLQQGAYAFVTGIFFTSSNYVCSTDFINVVSGETYILSFKGNSNNYGGMGFIFYNNGTYVNSSTIGRNIIEIPNGVNQIKFNIYNPNGITPSNIYEVQLELGSTATPYEPYTGGNPSPNPDYPQSINVVTGEQEVSVVGKNLYNYDNNTDYSPYYLDSDGGWTNGNSNTINQRIGITSKTISIYIGSKSGNAYIRLGQFKSDGTFINRTLINQSTNNITLNDNCSYIWLSTNKDSTNYFTNVSVVYGTSVSNYEEYTGQSYEINLGKNLFDKDNANILNNVYIALKILETNGCKSLYIPCQPNTTYTVSKVLSARFTVASTTYVPALNVACHNRIENRNATSITITTSSNDNYLVVFYYYSTYDTLTEQQILDSIQIEKGTQATTYSPYFTPIELCGIGDYKDAIKKGSGKNLFDKNNIVYGKSWNDGPDTKRARGEIKDRPNQDITISVKNISNLDFVRLVLTNDNFSANLVAHTFTNNDSYTLTPNYSPQLTRYEIEIQKTNISSSDLENVEIQIEKGSSATTYEPHNWYIEKNIAKLILNGSETSWIKNSLTFYLSGNYPRTFDALCSHFIKHPNVNWTSSDPTYRGKFTMYNAQNQIKFMPIDENIDTLEKWKTWLGTHNTIVYYALETPDTIDITDETLITQLDALYTAEMSNGINYINTNTENVLPYIDLKYNMVTTPRPNPEHPVDIETINGHQTVQMHGKNLLGLRNGTYATTDVTATVENGEIVLNGTAGAVRFINITLNTKLDLEIGQNYTTSMNNGVANGDIRLRIDDSGNFDTILSDVNTTKTFTYASSNLYGTSIKIRVASGTTLTNFKLKPMIEKGTTASQYEAYTSKNYDIDLSSKNLLKNTNIDSGDHNYWLSYSTYDQETGTLTRSVNNTSYGGIGHRINLKNNTTYTISCLMKSNGYVSGGAFYIYNATVSKVYHITPIQLTTDYQRYSFTFTTDDTTDFTNATIRIDNNGSTQSGTEAILTITDVMLVEGTDTEFAPYFNPIELCKIGDYKDSIRKGYGKNLFDKSTLQQGGLDLGGSGNITGGTNRIRSNFIPVKPNTNYTISNIDTIVNQCGIGLYKSDNSYDTNHKINNGDWNSIPITFTTQSDTAYIRIAFRNSSNTNITPTEDYKIQLEEGNQATTYEPYHHTDKWYIEKQIGKVVLDGSENSWSIRNQGDGSTTITFNNNQLQIGAYGSDNEYCNRFSYEQASSSGNEGIGIPNQLDAFYIQIKRSRLSSLDVAGFKNWLSTNNTTFYYILATPTTTEITDSELISQLNAIQSDLIKYKVSKELILDYDTPELEYLK